MSRLWAVLAVVASACIVGALATAVFRARTPTRTAEAVLVVPAGTSAESPLVGDPSGSAELASTYVQILREDSALRRRVATALDTSVAIAEDRLVIGRPSSTAGLVSFVVSSNSATRARRANLAVRRYLRDLNDRSDGLIGQGTLIEATNARRLPLTASGRVRYRSVYAVAATRQSIPDALSANRLASNYAGLLLANEAILKRVSRQLGVSIDSAVSRISASNPSNTSTIVIRVTDERYERARQAVLALVSAVTGDDPVTNQITAGTLERARLPEAEDPAATASPVPFTVGGAIAGFILGLIAVYAYGSRNPRLHSVRRARELLTVPVTDLDDATPQTMHSLAERWREFPRMAFLPSSAALEGVAEQLAEYVGDRRSRAAKVTARSAADAFQVPADGPRESGIVLLPKGANADKVRTQIASFEGAGGGVHWVLLVPKAQQKGGLPDTLLVKRPAHRQAVPDAPVEPVQAQSSPPQRRRRWRR